LPRKWDDSIHHQNKEKERATPNPPPEQKMNRMRRVTLLLIVSWSAILGIASLLVWRKDRQQHLNEQLLAAVKRNDTSSALLALSRGADANARDAREKTPLRQTIWNVVCGRRATTCHAPTPLILSLRYIVDDNGTRVVLNENLGLTRALIQHGARVDAVDEDGRSALLYALGDRKVATARLLIERGANLIVDQRTANMLNTAVAYCRDASIVELMLQHGADPNQSSPSGVTPLGLAVYYRNSEIVDCLLRHGADPNRISRWLVTELRPLEYAEKMHLTDIAELLRYRGAN
jgi:hypothetical protein